MDYEIDDDSENLFVKELLEKYLAHWKLFIFAFVICFTLGFFYLRYTPKLYRVTSTILLKSEKNDIVSELSALEDLTIFKNTDKELENEIAILGSRSLIEGVVKKLNLNIQYYHKTKYSKRFVEIAHDSSPIKVSFIGNYDPKKTSKFIIHIIPDGKFIIKDDEKKIISNGAFNQCVSSPFGDIFIEPNYEVLVKYMYANIHVNIAPLTDTVDRYKSIINIGITNKNTSVVALTMTTSTKKIATEILNSLIEEYNDDVINDKNKISSNTSDFINERLDIINQELDILEKSVESFKSTNNLTDLTSEASIMLMNASESEKQILETTIQIGLADFLLDFIKNSKNELLPVNLGFSDLTAVEIINTYNDISLQRNKLLKISGEENPLLALHTEKLADLRLSLQQSLLNQKKTLELKVNRLKSRDLKVNSKIASLPKKERKLRDKQRQQQIKETLFLYLLEKREEAAISLAARVSNVKIIERAYATKNPIKPKKKMVFISCFLSSILFPVIIIFFKGLIDTKIRDIQEIKKKLKLPIIGNIPKSTDRELVTPSTDRSILAEAFRLMETNLDFLLSHSKKKGKTILVTSSIKGEGKSFVASNLGVTLGRSEKKVALLEMDLRSARLKKRMDIKGYIGITNYIKDSSILIKDIANNINNFNNLDIYIAGPEPPNPTELLKHPRIKELFMDLKKEYDYIIIDTPPITVVADTLLLSSYVDLCIYVIRQDYTDKRLLEIPKTLKQEKRFPLFSILYNDIDFNKTNKYKYNYGYGEKKENTFLKKIRKRFT